MAEREGFELAVGLVLPAVNYRRFPTASSGETSAAGAQFGLDLRREASGSACRVDREKPDATSLGCMSTGVLGGGRLRMSRGPEWRTTHAKVKDKE